MRTLAALAALASAGALLSLQILGGLEATEGASTYTRASMIVAMCAVALLPVFIHISWSYRLRSLSLVLCVAFVALLAYSLPAVVGRTGEIKHSQATSADMSALVRSDLTATMQRLEWARGDWLAECRSGNGPSCKGKAQTVQALEARVEKLRGELRSAPAGDLGSETWAWASAGTVSAETIRKSSVLAFAVGLDVAIWALVWMATALFSWQATVSATVSRASDLTIPAGTTDAELEELRKLLRTKGALTNNEIAELMGVVKSEASKRVSKAVAAGMVSRRRIGREVAVTLH
jgi:Ca2+/Na+ antiporter